MESNFFKLNWRDVVNGLIVAVGSAVIGFLGNAFDVFALDWAGVGKVALSAAIGYLLKKLFTTADGKVFGKF